MSTAGQRSSKVNTERTPVSLSDFQKELIKLESESESKNIMVYGDSNVGKTVLAGTCPPKTFWLVGEPGYKSAARMGAKGYGRRISDTATAVAAVEWLEHRQRYKQFEWLIVDGTSTMQDRFRLAYAAEAFDINPTKRQHRNLPDRPDYFNTQNFLKAWIPRLIDMPVNVLITAHAYRTDKTENGELLVFPGFQGKVTELANAISGLLDAVGYMYMKGDNRRILWQRFTDPKTEVTYYAGDKFNALGKIMQNPTMPEIIAKIDGTE